MSTSLYLITNSKLSGNETEKDWKRIVHELTKLNLSTTSYANAENHIVKEYGDWSYRIDNFEDEPLSIEFEGPFAILPSLYSNVGLIFTIYRYRLLYEFYGYDTHNKFRKDLFDIVSIIGGTEVIYLADNACDKLSNYLEFMAEENIPYEIIKQKMIEELGNPVTDYSKLDYEKLSYWNINEFFLDDFKDFKNKNI
ncbi:MAG: hypothetical protein ABR595_09520 [Psychroflexus sp.]